MRRKFSASCSRFTDYVLERLPHARKHDINHVHGEFEDEDGDWATDFIVADPVPPRNASQHRKSLLEELHPSVMATSAQKRLFPNEGDASFICSACLQYVELDVLGPDLECNCLCCVPCLQQQVERMLSNTENVLGRDYADGSTPLERQLSFGESMHSLQCPSCLHEAAISTASIHLLAPEALKLLEEQASQVFLKAANYMHCPGCNVTIEKVAGDIPAGVAPSGVPEFDRTVPFTELDDNGRQLSRHALLHKYKHYYRCPVCKAGFCGLCMKEPYHLGYTCQEYEEFEKAKRCIYCDMPIIGSNLYESQAKSTTIRELRKRLDKECVDVLWCVEKRELLSVYSLVLSVCGAKECKKQLQSACTRTLECGHRCFGIRGERLCLPCLEDGCHKNTFLPQGHPLPSGDDWCAICMVEPLRCCPSIQLKCGHIYHLQCAREKLKGGYPGPEITFGYMRCPQCSQYMDHASLEVELRKPLELYNLVKENAKKRLKMEKLRTSMEPEELEAYALNKYQYYLCCKCQRPYYGGNRDCGANLGNAAHNPLDLVCGGCSPALGEDMTCKKGHGDKYIEYKCRYCCSMATFFCFGRTHFCSNCHKTRPDGNPDYVPHLCNGPDTCPLKVAHVPNGQECCLGCSMCRILSQ